MSTTESTQKAQHQVLSALKQSQDAVVKAVETWSEAVGKLPRPNVDVPFAKDLPKPEEILDTTFDFAQKLLDAQRDFARNILKAATPKPGETEPKE